MSNEITRSPAVIAGEINQIKSQTSGILAAAFAVAGRSVIEIGRRLSEAKAIVPHGAWGEWLRDNVDYSTSTAENLMRCYREYGDEQIDLVTGKSPAEVFASLSYSQMVELFALPAPQRAEFVEANRDSLTGEDPVTIRELREQIQALKEQHDADVDTQNRLTTLADEAEKRADKAALEMVDYGKVTAERDAARARVAELEAAQAEPAQPQEVVVVSHEPTPEQIEDIRRAAIREAEEKHKAELAQITMDAEAERQRLEAVRAEAEQEAQKQIRYYKAMSNQYALRTNHVLAEINRLFSDLDNIIREASGEDAASGDRMRRQIVASIGKMCDGRGWQV